MSDQPENPPMRLWLLVAKEPLAQAFAGRELAERIVVRAASLGDARTLAARATWGAHMQKENERQHLDPLKESPWWDFGVTTCEPLTDDGAAEVIAVQRPH